MGIEHNITQINNGMQLADLFINKNYLIDLQNCTPVTLEEKHKSFSYLSLFEISKIVYDQEENINDKLVSVYSALSNFGSTALLILVSDVNGIKFYLGIRDSSRPHLAGKILQKSLKGNFPGITMKKQNGAQIAKLLEDHIPDVYSNMAVSSVSIVPGKRDDDKNHFVQGLEKLVDAMAGEKYTAVFIATPLNKLELENKKRGYEELYSALSQCAQVNFTYSENDSEAVAKGISENFSTAINEGISDTIGTNSGSNTGRNDSYSHSRNYEFFGTSHNKGKSRGTSSGTYTGTSSSHTESRSETRTTASSTSDTTTITRGTTSTMAITKQNKTVQALLEKIDEQLKRIKKCEAYGLWNSACYFVADDPETSIVAANTFKAIVAGDETAVENSFINLWDNEYENSGNSLAVMDYLRYGLHPRFLYTPDAMTDGYTQQIITPASLISGVELPILMGFPRKSVSGLTSVTAAEFGRNVFSNNMVRAYRNVDLGSIFHMGEIFSRNRVRLDLQSFSSHCFITGSTGSGKSNTTYKIIEELTEEKNNIRFLVIEPAKGEYKMAFGGMQGIHIFTTSPKYYEMLSINPFEFYEDIHVLEHLDRLIEIFSACWPLYAAMPALLKAAFEQAYIMHGWDLQHSIHINRGNGKFPTFKDIMEILPKILEDSSFDSEVKGNYVGSLVTRVESLTNGLLGQIFSENTVDDTVLFDENTIVDLSRIGSAETKALLMGVLILKLSEYRQATARGMNCPLKHVTILEEAHNLLKRTSTEQGPESSNVQGKSVEMISNSIAEMRTYGEGFVIVDQSPTAVDISAIKNTNTKIVMRLPEANDCQAIGQSMGLQESQIAELCRLEKGVAAIYQNNWLEAVLTKIDKYSGQYETKKMTTHAQGNRQQLAGELLEELMLQDETGDFNMAWLNTILNRARVPQYIKSEFSTFLMEYQKSQEHKKEAYNKLIYSIMNCENLFRIFEDKLPPAINSMSELTTEVRLMCLEWYQGIYENLDYYAEFLDGKTKEVTLKSLLLHKIATEENNRKYKIVLFCIP
ncbi:helicase HerA domain-containing protein [Zhenpiania hominis]|uniref:ATP-binding protein n=1 Tax=Zhenpiania hominis TaxID=2763644 RepID=UPI0039F57405